MRNPETHTCYACGYVWDHGFDGSHSCVDRLIKQNKLLREEKQYTSRMRKLRPLRKPLP